MIASIMEDFNAKHSLEDLEKLTEQLHAENAALRQENETLLQRWVVDQEIIAELKTPVYQSVCAKPLHFTNDRVISVRGVHHPPARNL